MIFELPDIFFGSHPKKEMASQPPQVRQYGFIKKPEKALSQADFSKNPVISFSVLRAKKAFRKECFFFIQLSDRRVMSPRANNPKGEAVVNDSPVDCQSRRTDRNIFSAEKMQDRPLNLSLTTEIKRM